jgi:hypothetical protein
MSSKLSSSIASSAFPKKIMLKHQLVQVIVMIVKMKGSNYKRREKKE